MNLGASPPLECWNTEMMEYWVQENWIAGIMGKYLLIMEVKEIKRE